MSDGAAAAAVNTDLLSGVVITVLVMFLVSALTLFFGWTCTSGTFTSNTFNVSNCFVVPGLFTSNVAVTAPNIAPDAPCSDWNIFNCPSSRCQVDEVEGVCEDLGSALMELNCGADRYQSAITCPVVGCEWSIDEEKCAGFGEHCSYMISKEKCEERLDCQWDRYRGGYAMCMTTSKPLSPVDCRVIFNKGECEEDTNCIWKTNEVSGVCLNPVDTTQTKCDSCHDLSVGDIAADCETKATNIICNQSDCCGWVPNEEVCRRIAPDVDC